MFRVVTTVKNTSGSGITATELLDTQRLEVLVLSDEQPSPAHKLLLDPKTFKSNELSYWSLLKEVDTAEIEVAMQKAGVPG